MKVIESSGGAVVLSLNHDELIMICNSLNEVVNGIDVFEFETRLGASRDKVFELMAGIKKCVE